MVTGRLPFQGNSICAVLTAIASETPPPASVLNSSVPPRLEALINKLLAKAPADRPKSMQAVLEELQEIETLQKSSTEAPVDSPKVAVLAPTIAWNESARASSRRKWIAGAVGAALVAIGVFAAWGAITKTNTLPALRADCRRVQVPIIKCTVVAVHRLAVRWSKRNAMSYTAIGS